MNVSQRLCALLFCMMFVLIPCATALDVPSPQGYVTDSAGMLSAQDVQDLNSRIREIETNTSVEIAVLIIPSLEGESLEEYATKVFRQWGVGKEDVNNGVLILVVQKERKIRIETGYGVEGAVTDITSGMIIRERIAPAFFSQQYAAGLALAIDDIAGLIREDPSVVSQYARSNQSVYEISAGDVVSIFLLCLFYLFFLVHVSYKYPKGSRSRMKSKAAGFFTVIFVSMILAFVFSSLVFWATLFVCVSMLSASSGGPIFMGGFGGGGWGGSGGFGGGGFGGFGGGSSGGGGASGGW